MKQTDIDVLMKENIWDLIGKQWMLITAGSDAAHTQHFNTMTASWGGLGWLWNKPVAFLFIRPERYTHDFVERHEELTLSFLPTEHRHALQVCGTKSGRDSDKVAQAGLTAVDIAPGCVGFEQARLTIRCRKLFHTSFRPENFLDRKIIDSWYNDQPGGSLHDLYIVEIIEAYTN